ncbi:hypothetical protein FGO68_gene6019 [Halteria grandinella]|uniref:Uncharacterized protein n=1 Tax=Halteria grandinella TaxID=5974 RepID=A0A8J8NAC0_HALGN|nr:hypothetical protein FGO68_gene6019 [Halteria grandinella]
MYFDKVRKIQTNYTQISEQNLIKKISSGLERYGKVDVKRERASEERERISNMLHYNLEGRLSGRKSNRVIVDKKRDQWSQSVLQMHKRQSEQVRQRNMSITEMVNIKKTYDTLKRDDQLINYQDIIREYRNDLTKVKIKHYNLSKSNERSRLALEKLQVQQRASEMRKKTEMFENLWSQTLLPRNRLGDVQLKNELKEPQGNFLTKAKELSLKILGKPMPAAKTAAEEEGSEVAEEV